MGDSHQSYLFDNSPSLQSQSGLDRSTIILQNNALDPE